MSGDGGQPIVALRALDRHALPIVLILVIATLGWWMGMPEAIRTGMWVAAFAVIGIVALSSSQLQPPSPIAAAGLAVVLSGATVSLGVLAFALLRLPITPLTVLVLGLAMAVGAAVCRQPPRTKRDAVGQDRYPERAACETARPSHAALAGCIVLSATALFVLSDWMHRAALTVFVGAFISLLWDPPSAEQEPARPGETTRFARLWDGPHLVPVIALGLLLATRLLPFAESPVPLGYDTGLYRAVQREFAEALPVMPVFAADSWGDVQPPGLFVISNLLHLTGASPEALLWGLLILVQMVGAAGIWLLGSDLGGRRVANWAIVLFVLSSAQYVLFFQVYFKQALALALLPYVLWLWRRESWLVVPAGALLAATHTMGFLLLGLILLSDFLWPERLRRLNDLKRALAERGYRLVAGTGIFLLGLASYAFAPRALTDFLSPSVAETLAAFGVGTEVGLGSYRLDAGYYGLLVLPLVPFAALTLTRSWREPACRLVVLWAGWSGAFVALDLIFGRRFIGSFDPAFLLLAAVSIAQLASDRRAATSWLFIAIALVGSTFFLGRTVADLRPEIAIEDLRDLEATSCALPPDAYVMAVSAVDTPWVRGYGGRDTIGPGFLEHDQWSRSEWGTFWSPAEAEERYDLLARYSDRPLYVFMRGDAPVPSIVSDPQFSRISRTLWEYRAATSAGEGGAPTSNPRRNEHQHVPVAILCSDLVIS